MNRTKYAIMVWIGCIIVIAAGVCYDAYNRSEANAYTNLLEKQNHDMRVASFQKDIDYLQRESCKDINITAVNNMNEVKVVHLVNMDCLADAKYVTVLIDGHQKSYAYQPFMEKVIKVECGDDFAW